MKYSIRDLMWLTIVVALVLGWWLDHRRAAVLAEKAHDNDILEASNSFLMKLVTEYQREEMPNSSAPAPQIRLSRDP